VKVKIEMEVMSPERKLETMTWVEASELSFEEFVREFRDLLRDRFLVISLEDSGQLMIRVIDIMRVTISCLDVREKTTDGCVQIPAETAGTAERKA
jgi:hypothetical protein